MSDSRGTLDEATKQLLSYGILGLAVLVEGFVIGHLWRKLWTMAKEHKEELKEREDWHQRRFDTLNERCLITTTNFANHGLETGEALKLIAANIRGGRTR